MAKSKRSKMQQSPVNAEVTADVIAEVTADQNVVAPVVAKTKRLPFAEAHAHNKGFTFVAADGAVAADVALTAKGTNVRKLRVYGYDNLSDGGKVPKEALVVLVDGVVATPKGVSDGQWDLLQKQAGKTVAAAYDGGVASRTVRRAYRAGAIRFSK